MKLLHHIFILTGLFAIYSCSKGQAKNPEPPQPPKDTTVFKDPVDPAVAGTVGFFLDDWSEKRFVKPAYDETPKPSASGTVFIKIDGSSVITKIPKYIAGQNANSWMGKIVTEPSLMNNIKNLNSGVIRFPGGSISDTYFWNQATAPPADAPASLIDADGKVINNPYWYGNRNEGWTITVDDYYNLLQQTGDQGLITVNYGYARYGTSENPVAAAAHLAAEWVRYDNGRTKYWEIGNECNGTWEAGYRINTSTNRDGQPEIITGALYGQHARVFIDSMRKAAQEIGKTIHIGIYLLEKQPEAWQTATDKSWNNGVLSTIGNKADYYVIHSYYTAYQTNASAGEILATASDNTTAMMNYLKSNISGNGASIKPVALDEWNITSQGSMQQVSYINGMHATILMAEAIKNKYGLTARWDLANGWADGNDHGLFNIGDEPGVPKWNPRPAFYYMYYFQKMVGDRMLTSSQAGGSDVLSYASSFSSGEKGVVLINKGKSAQTAVVTIDKAKTGSRYYYYTLTGGNDIGEFSHKVFVNGKGSSEISGGPSGSYTTIKAYSSATDGGITVSLPPMAVVYLVVGE